jgi:hypothetical protein
MKRIATLTSVFLLALVFLCTGCTDFANSPGVSVWSGGLWILPTLLLIGALIFGYNAWTAYNSGTVEGGGNDKPYVDYGKSVKPPMSKNGHLWFSVIFLVAFIVVVYVVVHGR